MHAATELEKRGVAAVAVCTTPFERTARMMAERQGFADYKFILVQHPISSLNREQVRERAEEAVEQLLSILGVDQPAAA